VTDERARRTVPSRTLDDRWPDRFAAVMYAFAAFTVVASSMPDLRSYFARPEDVVSALTLPVYPSLAYAALLAVMAVALRRRIRAAWWLTLVWWLVVPEVARLVFLVDEWDWASIVGLGISGAAIVLAWRVRDQFVVHHVAGSLRRAALIFFGGTIVVLLVGGALIGRFGHTASLADTRDYVLSQMLTQVGHHTTQEAVSAPFWVHGVIGFLGAVVIVLSALMLFRPTRDTRTLSAADEARVRTLLREHGDLDSLGYFATRRDKAVVWDHDDPAQARAGVSYRAFGSISLASGNPVGDPAAWDAAIGRWRDHARGAGLSMAVMGPGAAGAAAYARAGLNAFELGDEAINDCRAFSLGGPGMKPVRTAVARLKRRGYTTSVRRHHALDPAVFAELGEVAGQWRGDGGDERGFSMALGRVEDPLDGDCVLVEARDARGALRGFLSFVPWGRDGLSLDLMRRDPTADNGLVELMVAALAERSSTIGIGPVSLNFAMFREAFERGAEIGAGPVARLWRQALLLASRNWQLESLYRSNAKYQPRWQPRFLCFEYASDLPRVGAAAGNAEGFLSRPSLSRLLRRAGADEGGTLASASLEYAEAVRQLIPPPEDAVAAALSCRRVPEQVRVRRDKVARLRDRGVDPYPTGFQRTHTLAEVRADAGDLPPDTRTGHRVRVAGRVVLKRDHGGLGFATLRDGSGDLQVMVASDVVGGGCQSLWRRDVDLGDHLGITGEVVTTRSGELTVDATSLTILSKALRPLPDKHKGLTDAEARVRQRYVDLIVRPEAREVARLRSTVVRSVRDSLHARGFMEVETPVLQQTHGGANARPFETHINAYDLDLSLRIATELHLKRLLVGGLDRVFEIGRQFRNEGADSTHNPEFTSLEVYETYGDYDTMRVLTQAIVQEAATAVYGAPLARRPGPDGRVVEVDLSGDWPVKTVCEAVSEVLGEPVTADTPAEVLHRHAERLGLDLDPHASWAAVLESVYVSACESTTTTPVFYTDFPKENAPLARQHRDDPRLAEKWDLVLYGSEQGTAYSELVDPLDQRARLVAQSLLAHGGDREAMQVDEDFLQALEYGMPPSGGMGLGIDRLVMNLTGLSIRDTILFPLVKPERGRSGPAGRDE
jgi:lysyl-tRNA synthetase class 2